MIDYLWALIINFTFDDFMNFLAYLLFSIPVVFLFFAFTATMYHKTKGTRFEKLIKYTLVPIFVITDWYLNWTTAWIIFWDMPDSPGELVTARVKRYRKMYLGRTDLNLKQRWRLGFAEKVGPMLNQYDENHY